MADNKEIVPPKYDLDAKWDACLDLSVRRCVYSSLAGAFGGLLFFRSPVTRWASVAFGAGVGIGSAYTECYRLFDGSPTKLAPPKISENSTEVAPPKISESSTQVAPPNISESSTQNIQESE